MGKAGENALRYMRHDGLCAAVGGYGYCSCGMEAARNALVTSPVAEVARIAEGLTKAQREAVIRAELDGNLGRYFSRFISAPAGRGIVRKGLGTAVFSGIMLSSLGEQVRAHLIESTRS